MKAINLPYRIIQVVCLFVVIGFLMKIMNLPYASIVTMIALFSLSGLCMIASYGGPSGGIFPSAIRRITGMSLAVLGIGVLYRFLFWKGWAIMLMVGGISLFIAAILILLSIRVFEKYPDVGVYMRQRYLLPAVLLGALGLFGWFTPSETIYNHFSGQRNKMTYEQFRLEQEQHMMHRHPHSDSL